MIDIIEVLDKAEPATGSDPDSRGVENWKSNKALTGRPEVLITAD